MRTLALLGSCCKLQLDQLKPYTPVCCRKLALRKERKEENKVGQRQWYYSNPVLGQYMHICKHTRAKSACSATDVQLIIPLTTRQNCSQGYSLSILSRTEFHKNQNCKIMLFSLLLLLLLLLLREKRKKDQKITQYWDGPYLQ